MKRIIFAAIGALVPLGGAIADDAITVTGCAAKGVEAGCIVLRTVSGKSYNITAAQPRPKLGTYGSVTGTLKTDAVTTCMQGAVIDPASWTQKGKFCPRRKR